MLGHAPLFSRSRSFLTYSEIEREQLPGEISGSVARDNAFSLYALFQTCYMKTNAEKKAKSMTKGFLPILRFT